MPDVLKGISADSRLLFATRVLRLFAYGWLSVVLVLYLVQVGLSVPQVGLLLTLTLVGDTVLSLWITTAADRWGRRRMLLLGTGLMVLAAVLFAVTRNVALLVFAATVGVISPSGNEIGPFLSIELAALSQTVSSQRRTHVFAWYNLVGSFATALGALAGGGVTQALQTAGWPALESYRVAVIAYGVFGVLLAALFARLSPEVEVIKAGVTVTERGDPPAAPVRLFLGLHRSRGVVLKLSGLFALDAFGGGFVLQSIVAYWFHARYGVTPGALGGIFFGANLLAGISALSAARLAAKIGLINTMVFTHIPSNVLLMLVPLMPNVGLAVAMLWLRFSISQMDVPTRQSYTMAVVDPDERSAAAGITGVARTVGASLSPILAGALLGQAALLSVPFYLSGGLKTLYDVLLYRNFKAIGGRVNETERARSTFVP